MVFENFLNKHMYAPNCIFLGALWSKTTAAIVIMTTRASSFPTSCLIHPWAPPNAFLSCPIPPTYVRACYWPQGILLPPVWGWAATRSDEWARSDVFTNWAPEVPPAPLELPEPIVAPRPPLGPPSAVAERQLEATPTAKKRPKIKKKSKWRLSFFIYWIIVLDGIVIPIKGLVLLKLMLPSILSLTRPKAPHSILYTH